MRKWRKEYRHICVMILYMCCYLLAFGILEKTDVPVYIIDNVLDKYIPFCKYFVVFYYSWFLFLAGSFLYFGLKPEKRAAYWKLAIGFMLGMTVFIIVSFLYPNGHNLRPELVGNDIFTQMIRLIYSIDPAKNVLPSMHVYCAVLCMDAFWNDSISREKKWIRPATGFLTLMIILSTMLIKQHTLTDVYLALICNIVYKLDLVFYKRIELKRISL